MKRYYTGNGWSDEYDDALHFNPTEAMVILQNLPDEPEGTMTGAFLDAGGGMPGGVPQVILIRVMDPDL